MAAKPTVTRVTSQPTTTTGRAKPKARPAKQQPLAVRAAHDPALLARALKDPGLRSKLPDNLLTPDLREGRRLNQPVLPGSSLTNREVEKQVGASTDLQFGPNAVPLQQQRNRDTLDWYAQYQRDLQQHAQNVAGIARDATNQVGQLQQGMNTVAAQSTADRQQAEAQNAAVTGAKPADVQGTAQNAAQVRAQMLGALGAGEAGRGAARSSYADTLANVVAPGQKLQAAAAGQTAEKNLRDQINSYKTAKTGEIVDSERKSLLSAAAEQAKINSALQIAGINADTKTSVADIQAQQRAADRAASQANARANRAVTKRGQDLGHQDRQASINARGKNAKGKGAGKSPWLGQASQNTAKDNVDSAVTAAKSLKGDYSEHELRQLLLNGRAAQTIDHNGQKVKIPAVPKVDKRWVNVAMDIVFNGYISPANVKALHAAGIKVDALGYPTRKPKTPPVSGGVTSGAVNDAINAAIGAVTR